jgi:hypothetical protein
VAPLDIQASEKINLNKIGRKRATRLNEKEKRIAVSLGAPFWFDVHQKFMNVRSAGILPGEKKK